MGSVLVPCLFVGSFVGALPLGEKGSEGNA